MSSFFTGPPAKILDFDCECRPLSWYGGDWVTKEITAIAWAWVKPGHPDKIVGNKVEVRLLEEDGDLPDIIEDFRDAYDSCDIVTGHYIRGFDLPLLNGAALELGLPPLGPKMSHDTKLDLVRFSGQSKSQENLGALLGLSHPKIPMTQADWRAANRLTPEGIAKTRRRVVGDVRQHVEMRSQLLARGLLNPPRRWDGSADLAQYTP